MNLLKYAILNCGDTLDGIVVNHLDHLDQLTQQRKKIYISSQYQTGPNDFLTGEKTTRKFPNRDVQERIGNMLRHMRPVLQEVSREGLLEKVAKIVPIYATSDGPTHLHRSYYHS